MYRFMCSKACWFWFFESGCVRSCYGGFSVEVGGFLDLFCSRSSEVTWLAGTFICFKFACPPSWDCFTASALRCFGLDWWPWWWIFVGEEVRLAESIFGSRSRFRGSARPWTGPGERILSMCSPSTKYVLVRTLLNEPPDALTSCLWELRDRSDKLKSF